MLQAILHAHAATAVAAALLLVTATSANAQRIDYYGTAVTKAYDVTTLPTSGDVVVVGETQGTGYIQWFDQTGYQQQFVLEMGQGPVKAVAPAGSTAVVVVFGNDLHKVSNTGTVIWSRHVEAGYDYEEMTDVAVAPDGSVYAAGFIWFEPCCDDPAEKYPQLIRLNSDGTLDWHIEIDPTSVGYPVEGDSISVTITATNDGPTIAFDSGDEDPAVAHYQAADGALDWGVIIEAQTLVGLHHPVIAATSDGGYIVGGSYYLPDPDMALFKLDASGNQEWNRQIQTGYAMLTDVAEDPAGGYVASGIAKVNIGGPGGPTIDEGTVWRVDTSGETRDIYLINENFGGREVRLFGVTVASNGSTVAVGEQLFGNKSMVVNIPANSGSMSAPLADYATVNGKVVKLDAALSKSSAIQDACGIWIFEVTWATPDSVAKDMDETSLDGFDVSNFDNTAPPSTSFGTLNPAINACAPSSVPISATPASLSFSSSGVGDNDTLSVTITNDADTTVMLGSVPAVTSPFLITSDSCSLANLAGSAECMVEVAYIPTAGGNHTDELLILYNGTDDTLSVGLTGSTVVAGITVDPPSLPFVSNVSPTTPETKTYSIVSSGTANLELGTLSGLAPPFALMSDNCSGMTLAPLASCTFDVEYDPQSAGLAEDSVIVPSNVPSSPSYGVAKGIALTAPTVVFPEPADPFHDESPFEVTVEMPGVGKIQYEVLVGWKNSSWVYEFDQGSDTTGWGAEYFMSGETAMFFPPDPFNTNLLKTSTQDYRNFRVCLYLIDHGGLTRCSNILPLNLMFEPLGLSPVGGQFWTQLPVFEAVWEDPNLVGPIKYVLHISGEGNDLVFDQRIDTEGWSQDSYQPGDTVRFYTPLADSLPQFAGIWSMRGYDAAGTRKSLIQSVNTFGTPLFGIRTLDGSASESGDTGTIEVWSFNGSPVATIAVKYSHQGTATPFVDYNTDVSNEFVIPAGAFAKTALIIPQPDGEVDPGEVATLKTEFGSGYQITNAFREAPVTIDDGPSATAPGISHFAPKSAGNAGSVTLSIVGVGLQSDATATLEKGGTVLNGLGPHVTGNGTILTVSFDLLDAPTGAYTLKVMSGGSTYSKPGFTVEAPTTAGLWADATCPQFRRFGSSVSCSIVIHNPDNNDAVLVPLYVSGASHVGLSTDPPVEPDVPDFGSWSDVPSSLDLPDGGYSAMVIPVIPAGSSKSFTFSGAVDSVKFGVAPPLLTRVPDTTIAGSASAVSEEYLSKFGSIAANRDPLSQKAFDCWVSISQAIIASIPGQGCAVALSKYLTNSFLTIFSGAKIGSWSFTKFAVASASMFFACAKESLPWLKALSIVTQWLSVADKCSCLVFSWGFQITAVNSNDPNDKLGPVGTGANKYITSTNPMFYNIRFENKSDATAPALEVFIDDTLDTSVYDLTTFELGTVYWGDTTFVIPPGLSNYSTTVDLRPGNDLLVDIMFTLDPVTGRAFWKLAGRDPDTGLPPADPFAGFLPPNVTSPEGEGGVTFTVDLLPSVTNGTVVSNRASIVFDVNEPILTPTWTNIIDESAPNSAVAGMDALQNKVKFPVNWSGSDGVAGVLDYTVFVSRDDSAYVPWVQMTTATSDSFVGERGSTYRFYSVARDAAGNTEAAPGSPDATTSVASNALPVELTSFEAVADGGDVVLTWATATETNNAGFDVEHLYASGCAVTGPTACSEDSWESLGFVDGAGTSVDPKQYSFRLPDAAAGKHRFRLRQLDFDGSTDYSDEVEVLQELETAAEVSTAYPNPFDSRTRIDVLAASDQHVQAQVFDIAGRLVRSLSYKRIGAYERSAIEFRSHDLPSGVYIIRIAGEAFVETRRVVLSR